MLDIQKIKIIAKVGLTLHFVDVFMYIAGAKYCPNEKVHKIW